MTHEPDPAMERPEPEAAGRLDGAESRARQILRGLDRGLTAAERTLLVAEEEKVRAEAERLRRRVAAYERLAEGSRALTSILDIDVLLAAILKEVVTLTRVDRSFLLLAEDSGALRIEMGYDARLGPLEADANSEVSTSIARRCLEEAKLLWISDALEREEFRTQESIQALKLYEIVCAPLVTPNGPIGVLYLDSRRPESFVAAEEREVLEAFAAQAAIALENARLHRELTEARACLERENRDLRRAIPGAQGVGLILGRSRAIEELRHRIAQVQEVHSAVMILGETGTGKDLVARAIHGGSLRASAPFLAVHCGALPEDLLESEMFGHKRGSFTGAMQDKQGVFEAADGGTLFLDEIGEMPVKLQVKLLRALESGEIRRVGENHPRKVDVRVLSATNRDLEEMIADGSFREDLYYRLKVVTLLVPPLRDRSDDILFLAEHFLRSWLESVGRPYSGFTEAAVHFLLEHPWPGNVRELRNVIEGAAVFLRSGTSMDAPDLQLAAGGRRPALRHGGGVVGLEASLRDLRQETERQVVMEALDRNDWNVSRTARDLGISRQHLHNRIRHFGFERPRRDA
jgi:transcriptional regulator with GAF, ATPase, and Fis domain